MKQTKMINRNILFFGCLLLGLLLCSDVGNSDPLVHSCPNNTDTVSNTNSDSGGTETKQRINLDFRLPASGPSGFSNFSATSGLPSGGTIYFGEYMCRGDVSSRDCDECLQTARQEILQLCPNKNRAYIWYDICMLRYSDQPSLHKLDRSVTWYLSGTQNVTDTALLSQVLGDTFNQIATRAAADDPSGKKFAVQEANFTWFLPKIYALGQCTPDLTSLDCETCLRDAISQLPRCCGNRQGGRVFTPSCIIRYETYPFYNPTPNVPLPTPASGSEGSSFNSGKSQISARVAFDIALSIGFSIVLYIVSFVFLKWRSKKRRDANRQGEADDITVHPESLQYSLSVIKTATNNFSIDNKIGQGGFSGVYKGKLPDGQYIAVKRLSRSSGQGAAEFKNEIGVVAKLQHNNLVRLLGFCLEGEEKILVYEFVPNRSLDYFLFDPEKQGLLSWTRRHSIIGGIARGLLYLHEDSRLKIVHRDLKAGNILLDGSMNPKIADFGMAKICGVHESAGNTTRIAGTFGYMAPEYTRSGQYSVKSDVFSFGVVILEITMGKKNSSFYKSEDSEDLLSYAWRQWRDGTPLAMLDPTIGEYYVKSEVIQCIHIGLLCVEEDANKRPTMASVVYMLNSTSVSLSTPQRPAVRWHGRSETWPEELGSDEAADTKVVVESIAEASITEPYPR